MVVVVMVKRYLSGFESKLDFLQISCFNSPTAGFRMNSVSSRTDMTSISGLHGNQTLANVTALPYSTNLSYVVPWGWVALYAIATLIIIAGNGLVIVAVFRYQFLQTLTNTFVVGVAAIDLSMSNTGFMKIVDLIWPNSMAGYGPCLIRLIVGSIGGVGSATLLLCKFMMTSSNGNIFPVTGHLCGEFTGDRWIPRTKTSDAELWCFLASAPK